MKQFLAAAGLLFAACLVTAGGAAAQQAASSDDAGRPETKTVGDWVIRCFPIQSPSPCDMFQELDSQTTRQRVLSLSLAYVPGLNRHALQVLVPLDISIPKGMVIQTDSFTSPVFKYRRCDRNGCYVETAVDNSVVEGLAKSGPDGKINIVADNGKSYGLKFSLKGFAQAHDDMVAQARAKAKPIEKQGDQAAATPAAAP
ncbi:MAG TPA: invasion associated locus B family protein [Rhizomicrobium sp.]|nr:invasion associated locus B family protein [Rhizomicrobium sp.]